MPSGVYKHKSAPVMPRFEDKFIPEPMSGCWLWEAGTNPKGYGVFRLSGEHNQPILAHRVAWLLYKPGSSLDDLNVLHKCDTPACVNPDHLFLGTIADNNSDKEVKGRANHARGERHGHAILSSEDVTAIRAATASISSLSRTYGVSRRTILRAKDKATWRHIP